MSDLFHQLRRLSRRELFQRAGTGLGSIALASLLAEETRPRAAVIRLHPE